MLENIENIRDAILRNKKPCYQTTNRKEMRVRCPYCGDSRKDASAAHLYIEMNPPFRFHCFKCETSGVLNSQTLRDLEIFDSDLSMSLIKVNKEFKASQGIQKISLKSNKHLVNETTNSIIELNSLKYFNNRFGTNLDADFVRKKFKAVLDANNFFVANNIFVPKFHYNFDTAIGFLSSDSSHIVFRDTSGLQKRRYYNCNISNNLSEEISSKIYNINNTINIMTPKIKLVITEGIFDIIGIYLHFYKDTEQEKDTIFAAACGKGFNSVILNYIRLGFLDLDISIYSDGDVDLSFYREMKNSSPYLKNSKITVYYNSLYDRNTGYGKDYGVSKDQIKLRKIII